MIATRVEVSGSDSGVHVGCLDCDATLEVADGAPSGYWPTLQDVADAAAAHRCTIAGGTA